jgi:hypothetical protein
LGTRGTVFRGANETGGIPNAAVDELERLYLIRTELRGGSRWYELMHDRFIEAIRCRVISSPSPPCPMMSRTRSRFPKN